MSHRGHAHKWWVLFGVSLLVLVGFIDLTIVNTIMPGIQRDLHASVGELQWVMNGFLMAHGVLMMAMGRLGDLYGRRRGIYIGTVIFAVASIFAGLSDDAAWLVVWRMVQGAACALTFPCAAALVSQAWPENEQGRALGLYSGITGLGVAVGPVLGGLLLSVASWRWAFFINIPLIIVGFLLCWRRLEETPRRHGEKVDWVGLVLLVVGVWSLLTAIMESHVWGWGSVFTLGLLALAAVCFAALILVERAAASPLIDLRLFANRVFLSACMAGLAVGGFIGLGFFLAPLYLQNIRHEVPLTAGLMLLSISAMVVFVPPLIGRVVDETGPKPVIAGGLVCLAFSAGVQLSFEAATPPWLVLVGLAAFGIGWGLQQGTTINAAMAALPKEMTGLAVGALFTCWSLGSAIGLAIGGAIFKYLDRVNLMSGLAAEQLSLSSEQRELVRSLLSDSRRAKEILSQFSPGVEESILPLFHDAFLSGYRGAMWYLLITSLVGAALVLLLMKPHHVRKRPGAGPR